MSEAKEPTGPCRELYWSERDSAQKIEKLADAVMHLSHQLREALETIEELRAHDHAAGKIVIPMPKSPYERANRHESHFLRNPLGLSPESLEGKLRAY